MLLDQPKSPRLPMFPCSSFKRCSSRGSGLFRYRLVRLCIFKLYSESQFWLDEIEPRNIGPMWKRRLKIYLSSSLRAGNVGMKSFDLGRGTSENHLCFRASSADIRCTRERSVIRLVCMMIIRITRSNANLRVKIAPYQGHKLAVCSIDQNQLQTGLVAQKKTQLGTYPLAYCT